MNQSNKAIDAAIERVANSADGKILFNYLEQTYYNQASYTRGDPYETAFREGGRDVVADLIKRKANERPEKKTGRSNSIV